MRRLTAPAAALSCVLLSGCAALFNGTSERLILTSAEPDTHFFADAREVGFGTSAVATLQKRDLRRATLRASKEGCSDAVQPVATRFDPVTLLGFFVDAGLISILVIDGAATGAWQRAAYTDYVLTPRCP